MTSEEATQLLGKMTRLQRRTAKALVDRSPKEVAADEEVSVTAIYMRRYRAKKRMGACLPPTSRRGRRPSVSVGDKS
jgi:DNA-directed RNA polymerase specialized sigma24 family protein